MLFQRRRRRLPLNTRKGRPLCLVMERYPMLFKNKVPSLAPE